MDLLFLVYCFGRLCLVGCIGWWHCVFISWCLNYFRAAVV